MPELAGRRAICGDGAIGKTCVLNRYMYLKDDFSDAPGGYEPTIFEDQNCEAELGNYGLQACKDGDPAGNHRARGVRRDQSGE